MSGYVPSGNSWSWLLNTLSKIKLLILDFDGVLTDGYVYVDSDGKESARCSHRDGTGIKILADAGVEVFIISGQISPYVRARAEKMNVPFIQGAKNKREVVDKLRSRYGIGFPEIAFMGDDLNDIEVMKIVGVPIAVNDAAEEVKQIAQYITRHRGGEGAVREVCDLILKAKGVRK